MLAPPILIKRITRLSPAPAKEHPGWWISRLLSSAGDVLDGLLPVERALSCVVQLPIGEQILELLIRQAGQFLLLQLAKHPFVIGRALAAIREPHQIGRTIGQLEQAQMIKRCCHWPSLDLKRACSVWTLKAAANSRVEFIADTITE
jgi:hypothetical protein